MNIFAYLMLFSVSLFANTLSCIDLTEKLKSNINDAIHKAYPNVSFETLKIMDIGKNSSYDCDYVSFEFPKKLKLNDDVILKFLDPFKDDEFVRRSTKIYRIEGWANIL